MKGRTARESGGKVEEGVKVKDTAKGAQKISGNKNVFDEAEQATGFKKGGKVSAFKRGKESEGMKIAGDKAKARLDKPCRKSGGRVARASGGEVASGSRSPFSKAENISVRPKFKGISDIND